MMYGDPGTARSLIVEGGGRNLEGIAHRGPSVAVVASREEKRFADGVLLVWYGGLMVWSSLRRRSRVLFGDQERAASLVEGGGLNVGGAAVRGRSGAVVAAREEDHFAYRVLLVWYGRLMVRSSLRRRCHKMFVDPGTAGSLVK
jgi:hypothetical protein